MLPNKEYYVIITILVLVEQYILYTHTFWLHIKLSKNAMPFIN